MTGEAWRIVVSEVAEPPGYFFKASRAASLAPPTAFCTFPAAFSAAPSVCVLASPVTLPIVSLTAPFTRCAAPAILSLSTTALLSVNDKGQPPENTRSRPLVQLGSCDQGS